MADERSSGLSFRGGAINFKSGDHSGTVSGIPDKKRSNDQRSQQEEEQNEKSKQDFKASEYVDKSAQLNATLNSLAIMNVASIIRKDTHTKNMRSPINTSNPITRK